jgi:DNA replication protein DnaC
MAVRTTMPEPPTSLRDVEHHLSALKRPCIAGQSAELATLAAQQAWSHLDSLATLLAGEANLRRARAPQSRMRLARFPVIKT